MSEKEPSGVAAADALLGLMERRSPALWHERTRWVAACRKELAAVLGVDPHELPDEQPVHRRGSAKVTFTIAGSNTAFLRFHAVRELSHSQRWVVESVDLQPPDWVIRGRFGHGRTKAEAEPEEWPTRDALNRAERAFYWVFDELSEERVVQAYLTAAPHYYRLERQLFRRNEVGYVLDTEWGMPLI